MLSKQPDNRRTYTTTIAGCLKYCLRFNVFHVFTERDIYTTRQGYYIYRYHVHIYLQLSSLHNNNFVIKKTRRFWLKYIYIFLRERNNVAWLSHHRHNIIIITFSIKIILRHFITRLYHHWGTFFQLFTSTTGKIIIFCLCVLTNIILLQIIITTTWWMQASHNVFGYNKYYTYYVIMTSLL